MKIRNIISAAIGALLFTYSFSSCSDALDATPDGRVSLDEVFKDPDLCAAYFSSCFNNLPQKSANYYWFQNYPVALSDEGWGNDDEYGPILAYNGQASSTNFPMDKYNISAFDCLFWQRDWQQIRIINTFILRIPKATIANESNRSIWKGEAHTLRAYFYLQLLKFYGPLPIVTEPLDNNYGYGSLKKSPSVDVLKFICNECDSAMKSDMPWRLNDIKEKYRMTKAIALAIKSEASLFAASPLYNGGQDLWKWAYDINKDVYAQLIDHGYELYTKMTTKNYNCAYGEYFAQNNYWGSNPIDKETIWQSAYLMQQRWWIAGTPVVGNYLAGTVPTQELVDAYDMLATGKPVLKLDRPYNDETHLQPNYNEESGYNKLKPYDGRDPRLQATVIFNGSTVQKGAVTHDVETWVGGNCSIKDQGQRYSRTGYYLRKFANYKGDDDGKWKFYRLGAIMLNLAEAAVEVGNIGEAMGLVNEIRHRAGFDPSVDVTASGVEEARLIVRHERQVELAFEENRYFDTRRWTNENENLENEKFSTAMKITKDGINLTYNRVLINSDGSRPSKYSYLAKWHFWPISSKEAARMESLSGTNWQNPGW